MKDETYLTYKSKFLDKCILNGRKNIYKKISSIVELNNMQTILDLGVTANQNHSHSNFFENTYPYPERITALSNQDASWMEQHYAGLKYVRGDGKDLPFENDRFDFVFSSAVLEHVGNRQNQQKLIQECVRVAKKHVIITTPNRFYPIEFHSALPLVHWLPKKIFFHCLKLLNKKELADENVLNLCSKKELKQMLKNIGLKEYEIHTSSFLGFPSNLILHIKK